MASAEFEDITECRICLAPKNDPKLLLCNHSYCSSCLIPMVHEGRITCPECRNITEIPPSGVKKLPADFMTNRLISILSHHNAADSTICDTCHASEVKYLCRSCHDYFCVTCGKAHKTMDVFKNHELVLSEKCQKHPKKDRLFACVDCEEVMCNSCVMCDHQTHKVEDVTIHIQRKRNMLTQLLHTMRLQCSQKINENISVDGLIEMRDEIYEKIRCLKVQVEDSASVNIQRIERERNNLLEELDGGLVNFDDWFVKNTEGGSLRVKVKVKVKEITSTCDEYVNDNGVEGVDAMDGFTLLTPQVRTIIAQINDVGISPLKSLLVPQSFESSMLEPGIGHIVYPSETRDAAAGKKSTNCQSLAQLRSISPKRQNSSSSDKISEECQIFVECVPKDIDEDKLKKFFGRYGKVVSVRIIPSKTRTLNYDYGFITFKKPGMAQAALNSTKYTFLINV